MDSRLDTTRGWGRGAGWLGFMGTELLFGKTKTFWKWTVEVVTEHGNILEATESNT